MSKRTKDSHLDKSKLIDFFQFCARARDSWPILPITTAKLFRWFNSLVIRRKLGRSWKSVLPYKKAVMRWAGKYQKDPFDVAGEGVVDDLRKAFKNMHAERPAPCKIQCNDELFEAVLDTGDTPSVKRTRRSSGRRGSAAGGSSGRR